MNTPTMSSGSHGEQAKRTFAAAVRFAGLVVAVAMAVLVLGLLWVSGCKSGTGDRGASAMRWCSTQPVGDRLSADSAARRPRGVRPDLSGLAGTAAAGGSGRVPAGSSWC